MYYQLGLLQETDYVVCEQVRNVRFVRPRLPTD